MIIYQSNKERFIKDLISNEIHEIIEATYKLKTGHRVAKNELRSWQESMRFMGAVMDDEEIPNDAGVSIEYSIPQTSKRIDIILTGQDQANNDQVVIIELKQWASVKALEDEGNFIETYTGGNTRVVPHPAQQITGYEGYLKSFVAEFENKEPLFLFS
jgi:hypothetical protein